MARNEEKYDVQHVRTRTAELITDGDGGDSVDLATAITGRSFVETKGKPTVCVNCEFNTTAATVVVACVLYTVVGGTRTLLGVQTATATATTYRVSASGDYVANLLFFDTAGAELYEIRVADPSVGTVDVRAWET